MKIDWGRACAGALIAEIAQIAAAFGWVAIYSYLINPGQPMATYQAHAQASGPWVSILAGAPNFYAASRWIARSRTGIVGRPDSLIHRLPPSRVNQAANSVPAKSRSGSTWSWTTA